MSIKEKRVILSKIGVKRIESLSESTGSGASGESGDNSVNLPEPHVSYNLNGETIPGFEPAEGDVVRNEAGEIQQSMTGYPSTEIAIAVPEDDMPRVRAWFSGDYHGVTLPQSLHLTKNMNAAILAALESFSENAVARDLYISPFRVAWSFKFSDGSYSPLKDITTLSPSTEAPLLPVYSHFIGEKRLSTRTIIRSIPSRLSISIPTFEESPGFSGGIESIDIFATIPTMAYEPTAEVAGLRNISIDGVRKRCWYYDRLSAEEVLARTEINNAFRLVGSIPYEEAKQGIEGYKISVSSKNKPLFSSLPQFGDAPGGAIAESGGKHLILESEPLHLGYPEGEKRLQRISLRGVFDREKISLEVYGAIHRGDWQLIAMGQSPHISGIGGTRCRWFKIKVEYDTREGDFIDYILFRFAI